MLRPITCKCSAAVGWYDTASGCLHETATELVLIRVFGAYLICTACNRATVFNGLKLVQKIRKQEFRNDLSNAKI